MNTTARIAILSSTILAFAACDEGYRSVFVRPEGDRDYAFVQGDSVQMIADFVENEVRYPFASFPRELYDSDERPQAFRWSSSDTAVATVSGTGMVRARRAGDAMIRAETQGITGAFRMQIQPQSP